MEYDALALKAAATALAERVVRESPCPRFGLVDIASRDVWDAAFTTGTARLAFIGAVEGAVTALRARGTTPLRIRHTRTALDREASEEAALARALLANIVMTHAVAGDAASKLLAARRWHNSPAHLGPLILGTLATAAAAAAVWEQPLSAADTATA